ncbi:ATP-binding protein [Streptomyces sp. 8N706]|uniref:ATP-binding protein n=1 Tax=Streptomyces sp. 8N706 TaxID=3457416 RepID=UPI003FD080CB
MDQHLVAVLAWVLAACALVSSLLAVQQYRARRGERATAAAELAAADEWGAETLAALEGLRAELRHLADGRVPGAVAALTHPHLAVPGLLDPEWADSDVDRAGQRVLDNVGDAVLAERQRMDSAARAALRGATTRIQAMSYRMQELLQELQHRYDGEKVMQDLIDVDFLNEQILRRIQVTGIVSDAWPGLARDDSYLSEIVMGASSRLLGYQRIQVTNHLRDPVAVVARAVEPVAVALTELLANALHHSPPALPVRVVVQQTDGGASVTVDDAGVGMHADERQRAAELMTAEQPMLLTELGDPPRSGFAAIGQLCRAYGFRVHVEPSVYGGVRATVFIPRDPLLTLLDESRHPMSAMAPRPSSSEPIGAPDSASDGPPAPGAAASNASAADLPHAAHLADPRPEASAAGRESPSAANPVHPADAPDPRPEVAAADRAARAASSASPVVGPRTPGADSEVPPADRDASAGRGEVPLADAESPVTSAEVPLTDPEAPSWRPHVPDADPEVPDADPDASAAGTDASAASGEAPAPGPGALPRRRRRQPVSADGRTADGRTANGRAANGRAANGRAAEDRASDRRRARPETTRSTAEAAESAEKWAALQRGSAAGRRATGSDADRTEEGNPPA